MRDVGPGEAEGDHRRTGVFDALEVPSERRLDGREQPSGHWRRHREHDRIGVDRSIGSGRAGEGQTPAVARQPLDPCGSRVDEPHAAVPQPLSQPLGERVHA